MSAIAGKGGELIKKEGEWWERITVYTQAQRLMMR